MTGPGIDVSINGEKAMWRAVILLFFKDIMRDRQALENAVNGNCGPILIGLKKHLLDSDTPIMEFICDFLDLDYKQFLNIVKDAVSGEKPISLPYL